METSATCNCKEKHQGHLCILKSRGLTKEVEHLTTAPAFSCFSCGAEANSEENLCVPISLAK